MGLNLVENADGLKLQTEELNIQVKTCPFAISFTDQQGNLLTSSCGVSLQHKDSGSHLANVKNVKDFVLHADGLCLKLQTESTEELELFISAVNENVIRCEIKGSTELKSIKADWTIDPEDHFYGFGERFDGIDQRGKEVELWVENGAYGGKTYKPIPFFMSPRGYGMMLNTTRRCLCRMGRLGSEGYYSVLNADSALDFYFIYGPKMKDILSRYLEIVGKPMLPEDWVFGPWKSRDWLVEDQATVYQDLEIQRELKVPCTVKLIDAAWETEYHSFIFDPVKYPAPQQMFRDARKKGYKIVLWVSPWIMEGTAAFTQAEANGYLVKKADGSTYVNRLGNDPGLRGAVIDFTNSAAVAWWQENLNRLMDMGAAGFKTDFGEQVAEDAVFYNGQTGREMHNLYPKLYNEITWEVVGPRKGILLARSAWHGSQSYPGIWAGDQSPDFCPWSGMPSVIRAGLSAGLSGFPYWTSDIGGYFGQPGKKVYIRWTQFGAFSPIMQVHGMGEHDPWNFDAETLHIYKGYAELHTRLFPYIYNHAVIASETGCPVMRAMPLEYQNDPQVYSLETASYQYMFGESLLVAPVFFGGNVREIYLPEGRWIDWWTGEEHLGPKVLHYQVALNVIPVFARAGSIIPMLPAGIETLLPAEEWGIASPDGELELEVYPDKTSILKMYDGQELRVEEQEGSFVVELSNLLVEKITIKFMGEPDLAVAKAEGCEVLSTAAAIPATAKIERKAHNYAGSQFVLRPYGKNVRLVVRK